MYVLVTLANIEESLKIKLNPAEKYSVQIQLYRQRTVRIIDLNTRMQTTDRTHRLR